MTNEVARGRWKPYPAYKPSGVEWLGDIPAHWEVRRLKYVSRFAYGDSLASDSREDGDVPVYGSNGQVGTHTLANTLTPVLIVGRKGSFGKVNFSNQPVFAIDTTYFIDVRSSKTDLRWLFYALPLLNLDQTSQDSAIPGLSRETAYANVLPVPAPSEQRAIAACLDRETAKLDALIAKHEQLIELLQEKRAALISRTVAKGLDPNAQMKDSGVTWFGSIPSHWTVRRLGNLCLEIADINHEMPLAVEEGVPFLSAKDLLNDQTLNFRHDVKMISEDDFARLSKKACPRRNDIIYSRIGACLGKARLVETDIRFLVSYSCCVIRLQESLASPRFYRHILDSELVLTEARIRTQGIGVPDLGLGEISGFLVPCPPLAEQNQIAAYLDHETAKLDTLISKVRASIEKLHEYRAALISAAVTGKMDVRGLV